jgi:uncharacterized protein (TIGR02453 family)
VELERNNERGWFQANRDRYESFVLEPAREFVEAMGVALRRFAKNVNADPRVGGSISRINRDTRFSMDKRPYKNHLDLYFWEGSGKSRESPGYWFRLAPKQLILAAGMHRFEPALLERFRAAVDDEKRGRALARALEKVRADGVEVGGQQYKRVPRGYPADHPRSELLLYGSLFAWIEQRVPREARTAEFPRYCAERYRKLKPVEDWVADLMA